MKQYDYLIVGGGIAGTTAAEFARMKDPLSSIAITEEEPYPLYSKVLIPKYLKGSIAREGLFLRTLEQYVARRIDFFPQTTIARVDFSSHIAHAVDGRLFPYKKLLIAAGGKPRRVFSRTQILRMHTLDDADHIVSVLSGQAGLPAKALAKAGVIGEGFIGLEFLELFVHKQFQTHLFLRGEYFREHHFGKIAGALLMDHFAKNDIVLHRHAAAEPPVSPDLLGIGFGLLRNFDPFPGIMQNQGVVVDEYLKASQPDVYAAGDIAEFYDTISKRHRVVGNWANAMLQGKIAGCNMVGEQAPFRAVTGYRIAILGCSLTLLGDTDNEDAVWEKEIPSGFVRVFLRRGIVRGALLINAVRLERVLSGMIERLASHHDLETII